MNLDLANIESNCSSGSGSAASQARLGTNPVDEPVPKTQDPGVIQEVNAKILRDFKPAHAGAEERTIGQIADQLVQRLERSKSKRDFVLQKKTQKLLSSTQPVYAYFSECIKQASLDVPIFERLRDSWLVIKQQKLSTSHCLAILKGCSCS